MNWMLELAGLCESAPEPKRNLDIEIGKLLQPNLEWHREIVRWSAPMFTSLIDEAIKIIPEGMEWLISNRAPSPRTGRAYINNGQLHFAGGGMSKNPRYFGTECTAATPCLALCASALRAKAWQLSDTHQPEPK